ncbi:MAG: hypothetical protein PHT69_02165 [Bacteroidales bacterium]|nr:hypothetical protein [Bacteroidales bacterium]
MEKPNIVKASAPEKEMLTIFIIQLIPLGYKIEEIKKHKRFFWQKPYKYTAELSLMRDIPKEIEKAVLEEKYEVANKLKKELTISEEEFYKQRNESIKKELESLFHILK